MYNLIMTASPGHWEQSPKTFFANRVFEYTDESLIERFKSLEGSALRELKDLPTLFAYESANEEAARIGKITELRKRQNEVWIEFKLDDALPAITSSDLEELDWELDIGEWEFNRTHWAVKDVDLLHELKKGGKITESQYASSIFAQRERKEKKQTYFVKPSVFRIPENGVEADLVSVMRPFEAGFDCVQSALEKSCAELNLRCLDVNQIWNETEIIQDIFSLIFRSRAVICDFSGRNPNVFYEAGIAHTLGRPVIPIVQSPEHIPFDLQHHRYIKYLANNEGFAKLEQEVLRRLRSLFKD